MSGDTRYLLITAGTVADEGHAATYIAAEAPERVQIWTVPDAGHTGGLQAEPAEWKRASSPSSPSRWESEQRPRGEPHPAVRSDALEGQAGLACRHVGGCEDRA